MRVLHIEEDKLTVALAALEEDTVDLVVLDRELPAVGDVVRQIAAVAPDVPVLFVAGAADPAAVAAEIRRVGVNGSRPPTPRSPARRANGGEASRQDA